MSEQQRSLNWLQKHKKRIQSPPGNIGNIIHSQRSHPPEYYQRPITQGFQVSSQCYVLTKFWHLSHFDSNSLENIRRHRRSAYWASPLFDLIIRFTLVTSDTWIQKVRLRLHILRWAFSGDVSFFHISGARLLFRFGTWKYPERFTSMKEYFAFRRSYTKEFDLGWRQM